MNSAAALERLKAWKAGQPLPVGKTLPWPRAPDRDRLVLAFVRMAGESGPWGAVFGHPGEAPTVLTVAEPRNADELAQLGVRLWEALREHVPHPEVIPFEEGLDDEQKLEKLGETVRHRQLWVPGSSHVSMLHFLDYRYTPARTGDPEVLKQLNALGRACGWLFRESTRPGQVRVLDATRRLRSTFAFPAETPRQQHLGFLLAWLNSPGTREERLEAARQREHESVGITMDPDVERQELVGRVDRYNEAKERPEDRERIRAEIEVVLRRELLRRYELTLEALATFDRDGRPPNSQLGKILDLATREFTYQYWSRETKTVATVGDDEAPRFINNNPETDFHPSAAAARYFSHVHASELTLSELVHGDPDLIDDAIDAGDALRGQITAVVDEGTGRAVVPVWTVVSPSDGPLRFREESAVCVAGLRGRVGRVRTIENEGGNRTLVVEITGWKNPRPENNAPAADDADALVGKDVVLVIAGVVGLSAKKSAKVWDGSGPGAWLTHSAPAPEPGPRHAPVKDLVEMVEKLGGG